MSTNKHFDKICCVVLVLTLVITVLFMNGENLGLTKASAVCIYEEKLFDDSVVHTIDIVMNDWDSFLENCTSEEYSPCTVVIDNESYKNVAIRAKGNTSLTQVKSYGNNRYSFKIEFDHYDSSKSYHGLDKLCLNNIIQDNTYLKDYLTYKMMREEGVPSPLVSFVYITVNGEDFGLYLAVESIEEAFLERNYGSDYGDLYKPDSSDLGGGRGNGERFDNDAFTNADKDESGDNNTALPSLPDGYDNNPFSDGDIPSLPDGNNPFSGEDMPSMPDGDGNNPFSDGDMPTLPDGDTNNPFSDGNMPSMPQGGKNPFGNDDSFEMPNEDNPQNISGERPEKPDGDNSQSTDGEPPEKPDGESDGLENTNTDKGNKDERPAGFGGGNKGGITMGSDDVLLKYIDDNSSSYSNIFDNAKTDVTKSDEERLISALKTLSDTETASEAVVTDEVISYFTVHNFVLNFDSYTGSMIHNYYLYEKDGKLQMLPWDYNLAFGGFSSAGGATSLVNYPIDSPVSEGDATDRPMIAWILENEQYLEAYHTAFSSFIEEYFESGYFEEMIDSVIKLISPYVEKDPTKFCTYDEFIKGSSTLKEFCLLRAKSIRAQLDGTIGKTTDTQTQATLIDASSITISDMGSMNAKQRAN